MSKIEAKETFSAYVKKKGLRATKQRDAIVDAFLSAGKHITIDDLYNSIRRSHPEIGYATVHRNLRLMCESGLAEEIKIGNKKARYEQKLGQEHHDHLICLRCGRFIEVNDEKIEKLQEKLAEANGFIPVRHKLEIYGICRNCR